MAEGVNPFLLLVRYAEKFRMDWQPSSGMGAKSAAEVNSQQDFERDLFDLLMVAMKCQQELNRR